MAEQRFGVLKFLCVSIPAILAGSILSSCESEPSDSMMDEAYQAGYDAAIADECGNERDKPLMMPSAYDDSTRGGQLASQFQSGYADATRNGSPCN